MAVIHIAVTDMVMGLLHEQDGGIAWFKSHETAYFVQE